MPKLVSLSQKDVEVIIDAYRQGDSLETLARRYHCSSSPIYKIIEQAGITRKLKFSNLSTETQAEIVRAFRGGASVSDIGKAMTLPYNCVYHVLKKADCNLRVRRVNNQDIEQMRALYDKGIKVYEIAQTLNLSDATVGNYLQKYHPNYKGIFALSPDEIQQAIKDYESGESSELIAKNLRVSASSICKTLKRHGVKIRRTVLSPDKAERDFVPLFEPRPIPKCQYPGIYKFTNLVNGKVYIGQSQDMYQRYRNHTKMRLEDGLFPRALKKYGVGNFNFEVLERVDDLSKINEREQFWMDFYQSYNRAKGYNLATIAASNRGVKRPPHVVEAMRVRGKLMFNGPNNPMFGRKQTEETKLKISEVKKQRLIPTESQVRAIQERLKKVNQIDIKTGEVIRVWGSVDEASQTLSLSIHSIKRACIGYRSTPKGRIPKTTHGGFKWQYV
ncbi:hypothetical protein GCM10027592_29680 [Spirosoma flavus]